MIMGTKHVPFYEVINLLKECDVILHNNRVAVILFDGIKIQIPHSELIKEKAYINFENDRYTIVSKEDFEKQNLNTKVKTKKLIKELESDENININSELY